MKRRLAMLFPLLCLAAAAVVGVFWARSEFKRDEWSAVDSDNVLRAAVSYRGALHLIRAENNASARGWAWDVYDVPDGAGLGDLYPFGYIEWQRLGVVYVTAPPRGVRGPGVGAPFPRGTPPTPGKRWFGPLAPWLFTAPYKALIVPYWVPLVLLSLPPAWAGYKLWRRHRRFAVGLCPKCGYDLRASNDRCPECGTPIAQAMAETDVRTQ